MQNISNIKLLLRYSAVVLLTLGNAKIIYKNRQNVANFISLAGTCWHVAVHLAAILPLLLILAKLTGAFATFISHSVPI